MRTTLSSAFALAALLVGAPLSGQRLAADQVVVFAPTARIFRDEDSGFHDALRLVVRDSAGWAEVWRRATAKYLKSAPLPPVDFRREMVLVAALGERSSTGYHITIDTVLTALDGFNAIVWSGAPGESCFVGAMETSPLVIIRVPKHGGPVRFIERKLSGQACGIQRARPRRPREDATRHLTSR